MVLQLVESFKKMIKTYDEFKNILTTKFTLKEISLKEFERYQDYSLEGDNSPLIKCLKGIFLDVSGRVNMWNDPFIILVFSKDNKVLGQRLNGGAEVVPDGLLDILNEVEYYDFKEK